MMSGMGDQNDEIKTQDVKYAPKLCCYQNGTQITFFSIFFVFGFCALLTTINVYELRRIDSKSQIVIKEITQPLVTENITEKRHPLYWYIDGPDEYIHVMLERLGYRQGSADSDWDLLWGFNVPFETLGEKLLNLKDHQKINHFPRSCDIANSMELRMRSMNKSWIPNVYRLPNDNEKLLQRIADNPQKLFVQRKAGYYSGIIENITIDNIDTIGGFVQEFIDRPLLVDGYKFDIGVFVIVTSIRPLRVYIYSGDVLIRYSIEKYYPFTPKNGKKLIVGNVYRPTWEIPALDIWFNGLGFSMRDSFDSYMRLIGKDPSAIWSQIEEIIRDIYLENGDSFVVAMINSTIKSMDHFFELFRIDFMVDEDSKVYLMDVNCSPSLMSQLLPKNQVLYDQLLFNMFGLVGVGSMIRKSSLAPRNRTEEKMEASTKNIVVYPMKCASHLCQNSCVVDTICSLCLHCLYSYQKNILYNTYKEYVRRGDFKRIFPPLFKRHEEYNVSALLASEDRFLSSWFLGKCMINERWC